MNFGLFYSEQPVSSIFPLYVMSNRTYGRKKLFVIPSCNSLGQFLCRKPDIGGDSSDCLCITDIEVAACVHCAIERTALLLTMLCNESTELGVTKSGRSGKYMSCLILWAFWAMSMNACESAIITSAIYVSMMLLNYNIP